MSTLRFTRWAPVAWLLSLLLGAPAAAQTYADKIVIGAADSPNTASVLRVVGLGGRTTGQGVLSIDASGDVFSGLLAKGDLPAAVGYLDEAETWSLLQTFTSGLTSNGLVTIGGSNDLLLGTGGMRAASGAVVIRNVADSSDTATFGDSAIALLRNTAVTGTFSASGLSTLTGGFTASAASTIGADLTFSGTGRRLLADMSNATLTSRFALQTSTTNGATNVVALPNGTSTTALFQAFNNATPTNAALVQIQASSTEGSVRTATTGSGTAIPLVFQVQAGESFRLLTDRTLQVQSAINVRTDNYTSRTTGWRITGAGAADFRDTFTENLYTKNFIADLETALNGGQIIAKSTVILAQAFTCPAAGATATLWVRDFPGHGNLRVFAANDWVVLRSMTRADADNDGNIEFSIADCVGQVTSYADGTSANEGTQSWTFTRGSGGSAGAMASSTVIAADAVVIDYGVSGQGFLVARANDGTEGANSPYWQVVTWTTAPVAANMVVQTRWGNLNGSYGYGAATYGFATGSPTGANITVDPTNGFRIFSGSTQRGSWANDGTIVLGALGSGEENMVVSATQILGRIGSTNYFSIDSTNGAIFGRTDGGNGYAQLDTSGNLNFISQGTTRIQLAASNGDLSFYTPGGSRLMRLSASEGLVVGPRASTGDAHLEVQSTQIRFCVFNIGCPLEFSGTTGNITSNGNLTIGGNASVTGSGSFGASGITLDATGIRSTVPTGAVAAGSSYRFAFTNGVGSGGLYAYDTTTSSDLFAYVAGNSGSDDYRVSVGADNTTFGRAFSNTYTGPSGVLWSAQVVDAAANTTTLQVTPTALSIDGFDGETETITVRNAAGTGTCTIQYRKGIKVGGSC